MRRAYQSDLSDEEWEVIESHLPIPRSPGRPRLHPLREILDAVFYVVRGGCAWRLRLEAVATRLRTPWKTVYHYFRYWRLGWYLGEDALSPTQTGAGSPQGGPSAQRGYSGQPGGEDDRGGGRERGYDGAKKVKGRKRHLLIDTQGLVLQVRVHSAKVMDREGIKLLLDSSSSDRLPRLSHLWLGASLPQPREGSRLGGKDAGLGCRDRAPPTQACPRGSDDEVGSREWAKEGVTVDPKKLLPEEGPRPSLPRRWVVERTFSWLGQNRRLSKDYERLPESGEAFIYAAMSRLMVRRLARS
jgi:putative transposase